MASGSYLYDGMIPQLSRNINNITNL